MYTPKKEIRIKTLSKFRKRFNFKKNKRVKSKKRNKIFPKLVIIIIHLFFIVLNTNKNIKKIL